MSTRYLITLVGKYAHMGMDDIAAISKMRGLKAVRTNDMYNAVRHMAERKNDIIVFNHGTTWSWNSPPLEDWAGIVRSSGCYHPWIFQPERDAVDRYHQVEWIKSVNQIWPVSAPMKVKIQELDNYLDTLLMQRKWLKRIQGISNLS